VSTPVPVWRASVDEDGKLHVELRDRFLSHLKTLANMEVEVVVKRRQLQRSLDQNAWIWGVAYPVIAEELGYDKHEHDDLHYALVAKCFGEHFDKRVGAMVPNKRSSKLTTKEFSEYMEWLVRFAATELGGIMVPLPNESEAA
jgi:hypothetical protein